jgi:[ribosomal protein S18]-alanine N-acetyltransferase
LSALWAARPVTPFFRRAMTTRDLETVAHIEAQAYGHPWSRGNFLDSLGNGHVTQVLHTPQTGVVGYFVALIGVDELHLLNITVAPAWQGQGLGSQLLQDVFALGLERGMSTLWLEVRSSNQRARALYLRSGFAEVGLRRHYYPAGNGREDAVVMSRLLSAALP